MDCHCHGYTFHFSNYFSNMALLIENSELPLKIYISLTCMNHKNQSKDPWQEHAQQALIVWQSFYDLFYLVNSVFLCSFITMYTQCFLTSMVLNCWDYFILDLWLWLIVFFSNLLCHWIYAWRLYSSFLIGSFVAIFLSIARIDGVLTTIASLFGNLVSMEY